MGAKFITITYEVWTEEDIEIGETDDRGWIDEEGVDMAPDEYDRDEGLTAVDNAVKFLQDHSATNPSESGGRNPASRWWTAAYGDADPRTGARENRSYHLTGFTEADRRAIQREMERS